MEAEDQATHVVDAPGAASRPTVPPRRRSVKRVALPISGDGVWASERGTTSAGSEAVVLALAPDGSALCYSADGVLHIRLFEQAEARPIPDTEDGKSPCFAPDGTRLAFVDREGNPRVGRLATGMVETIAERVSPIGTSWAGEDWIVFGVYQGPLHRVRSSGGEPEPVTTKGSGDFFGWYWPDVLPDGRAVLFSGASGPMSSANKVAMFVFETGETRILADGNFPRYLPTGHIVFARGGELWAMAFDADRLDVSGTPCRVLTGVAHSLFSGLTHFALAHDGSLWPTSRREPRRRTAGW